MVAKKFCVPSWCQHSKMARICLTTTMIRRLAMVGIICGALGEIKSGLTIVQQAQTHTAQLVLTSMVIVYASLVPVMNGAMREPFGYFTPRAEIVNARAAMLGFGLLLLLETKAGVPFF